MQDRRRAARKSVDLFFNKHQDGHPYLCRGLSLSTRGVLAMTYSEPECSDDTFMVELCLPGDDQPLWLPARSAWRRNAQHAIEFVELDGEARERIERYLAA